MSQCDGSGARWVDARRNDLEPERLDVLLEYRVRATRRVETLVATLDLTGGAA